MIRGLMGEFKGWPTLLVVAVEQLEAGRRPGGILLLWAARSCWSSRFAHRCEPTKTTSLGHLALSCSQQLGKFGIEIH